MDAIPCGMPLRRVVIFYSKTKEKHTRGERSFEGVTYSGSLKEIASAEFDAVVSEAGREWVIMSGLERSIFNKISRHKALKDWDITINYGIKTGFNEAFIIDEETKDRLIKEDKKSAEVIKPLLRGRDIKRYCYDYNNLYLLFIPWHFPLNKDNTIIGASLKAEEEFKNNYKAIYNHLLNFKEQLQKRNKAETGIRYEWYALQRCAASYYEDFEKDKIIYQEICQEASYALDECKSFIGNTGYIMTSKKYNLKVLLSLLNSKLYWWFFKNNNVILGDSAIRMLGMYIEVLPIIEVDEKIEKDIIQLVDKIIIAKKENKDTSEIEGEVDRIVYSSYLFFVEIVFRNRDVGL